MIVETQRQAVAAGGCVRLAALSQQARRLLALTDSEGVFPCSTRWSRRFGRRSRSVMMRLEPDPSLMVSPRAGGRLRPSVGFAGSSSGVSWGVSCLLWQPPAATYRSRAHE